MRTVKPFLVTAVLFIVIGCGVFSPRDNFENPDPQDHNSSENSFGFPMLLEGTGYTFSDTTNLNELLSDNFFYQDINSGNHIFYSKDQMITKLEQMPGSLRVVWSKGDGSRRPANDTVFIDNYRYSVFLPGPSDSIADYTGNVNMKIVKIDLSWRIRSWVDIPDNDSKSFFAPY